MAAVRARKLRLAAPSAPLLRRGVLAVEDALRTASFGEGSRVYVLRRFDVGAVSPVRGSASTAAGIARRFAAARSRAVHGAAAGAAVAEVVWFHDEVEPLLLLARRLLGGGRPHEWFWRLVLPAVARAASPREQLGVVLHGLASVAAAPVAIATVVADGAARAPGALLDALEGVAALALLAALGIDPAGAPPAVGSAGGVEDERVAAHSPVPTAAVAPPAPPRLVGPWPALVLAAARRWGPADGRVAWLAAVALVVQAPGLAASPALLGARARALVGAVAESQRVPVPPGARPARLPEPARSAPPGAAARTGPASDRQRPRRRRRADGHPAQDPPPAAPEAAVGEQSPPPSDAVAPRDATPGARPAEADLEAARDAPASPEPADLAPPPDADLPADGPSPLWETPLPTAAGGLFFSIRILAVLGLPAFLDETPGAFEAAFAARLLLRICERLRARADDPTVAIARALAAGAEDMPAALVPSIDLWLRRIDRWCRRHVGCSLRALVARPAHISASVTHVDVFFPLADADPRIRLAGLDIDPGWVPWLGRVVLFHYDASA